MAYFVHTAKSSKGKCVYCKEPVLKNEGCLGWSSRRSCFKCSEKNIKDYIVRWKQTLKELRKANHIGKKRMNELKIARML